jgi:RNA polymerase sigma-70 factor (ECF subfamily)
MPDDDPRLAQFEANRTRLRALARRMLGSDAEAEDAVQETWLRLTRTDPDAVENWGALLTTVVGRVCLDRLRARRVRPEDPAGATLPQETGRVAVASDDDPAGEALLADSVGAALWVVLDRLAPPERVAFVLHDVFAVPFDEIAVILERSPDAARQLASRARRRLRGGTPGAAVDVARRREIVEAFLRAARGGDFEALVTLLDPDVVLQPDAAAVRMGTLRETHGADAVATLVSGGARGAHLAIVDGLAAMVWAPAGRIRGVVHFAVRDGRIVRLDVVGDAERLRDLEIVLLDD